MGIPARFVKKVGDAARGEVARTLKELRRELELFKALVLDEIYTYVGAKARRHYVFTAYGITDLGYVVRFAHVFTRCNARSLRRFLAMLPSAERYYSDEAVMYGTVLGTKVLQAKGAMTNLVESFNAQLRQFVAALRRRTKDCAKSLDGFERQMALALVGYRWLRPTKTAIVHRKRGTATH